MPDAQALINSGREGKGSVSLSGAVILHSDEHLESRDPFQHLHTDNQPRASVTAARSPHPRLVTGLGRGEDIRIPCHRGGLRPRHRGGSRDVGTALPSPTPRDCLQLSSEPLLLPAAHTQAWREREAKGRAAGSHSMVGACGPPAQAASQEDGVQQNYPCTHLHAGLSLGGLAVNSSEAITGTWCKEKKCHLLRRSPGGGKMAFVERPADGGLGRRTRQR